MAKQRGIIKLDGTMADITFYRTKHGYMAKEKLRVAPGRMLTDPRFARTRGNMTEFGRACNSARVLKNAMVTLLTSFGGKSLQNRLTQEMMKVIHLDMVNPRGLRNVIDGEAELLEGFDFNSTSPLETSFKAPLSLTLDRVTGEANISINPFDGTEVIISDPAATHFKLVSAALDINFESKATASAFSETAIMKIESQPTALINLENALPPASVNPLFLLFGISFYQSVNGFHYPLLNGAFNALRIVKVSGTP